MREMNIVYGCNRDYLIPTAVSIESLLAGRKESREGKINLLVMTAEDISDENLDILYRVVDGRTNVSLKVVGMGDAFSNVYTDIEHISVQAYYRLVIADVFSDCDKCLYLDGDTIVRADLSELYDTDIEEVYAAGVKSINFVLDKAEATYSKILGIPDMSGYVNSGVLLFNLKRIREEKVIAKFMGALDKFPCMDQDIVNSVCHGKIKHLSWRYNFAPSLLNFPDYKLRYVFGKEDVIRSKREPVIIHYLGNKKPWNSRSESECPAMGLWWETVEKSVLRGIVTDRFKVERPPGELRADCSYETGFGVNLNLYRYIHKYMVHPVSKLFYLTRKAKSGLGVK